MSSFRVRAAVLSSTVLMSLGLAAAPAAATGETSAMAVSATKADRLAAVRIAKSINYYPSDAGWSAMWTGFDVARIEADLAKAAALGADNVRVIVFPQAFGWPAAKPEYTEKLRKFISIADSHGLTVKVTLFDWWSGYNELSNSINWAKSVIGPYANDPRVIAVELKNEFQPGDAAAVAWVKGLIPAVRAAAPNMPLTLSVDGATGAAGMARIKSSLVGTPLDYYDFHFYGSSERALAEIRKAQAAVAPDPVVIGETGVSSAVVSEGEQGAYLARVFRAAATAGVGSVSPWTLNDFAAGAIPANSSVSTMPAQYKFGLYRADGTAKFASTVVRTAWTTGTVPNSLLNLGFEAEASASPWRQANTAAGAAVITTGMARTGSLSARFAGTTRTSAGLPSLVTAPITPVQAGYRWRAEAYARGINATGTTEIALSWFDVNGKWISQNLSNRLPVGNTTWTKLVVEAVAPAGAASVQLHLKSGDNTGTVWFDDVAMS
ncbi:cellulase family glycosylhydrolase [Actinoplanes sp. NEAU-A12]|uniref:Cellulase family glycosylhydrolase n=1 Tax=Actinoplanes sandaracinus TaxID=3045177 RepID=A0ABT6WER2_9ACTN|nr:cellulase family glycosylhydrolase [Actinoplanes sandaracinus]MDI6098163.1 cellulase family glycosylhydrolase [Actinoplanes sandaracinus]